MTRVCIFPSIVDTVAWTSELMDLSWWLIVNLHLVIPFEFVHWKLRNAPPVKFFGIILHMHLLCTWLEVPPPFEICTRWPSCFHPMWPFKNLEVVFGFYKHKIRFIANPLNANRHTNKHKTLAPRGFPSCFCYPAQKYLWSLNRKEATFLLRIMNQRSQLRDCWTRRFHVHAALVVM